MNDWGEAEERDAPRAKHALSATVTVRFAPDEAEMLRGVAKERGLSYTAVVRAAVKAFAKTGAIPTVRTRNITFDDRGRPVSGARGDARDDGR